AWSLATFSTDGKFVGVSDDGGTRVYDASDGRLVRMFPAPYSTGQFAYSLAISSRGLVAVGRVGGVDVYALDERGEPAKFYCGGICGPVSALAFSPNGAWLASQAARSTLETTPGLVNVVDLRGGVRSAELEASSTRAGVMFAGDGGTLIAANVTRIDGAGTFGMRRFSGSADWRRTRDLVAVGPRGDLLLGYESPVNREGPGAIVLRRMADGVVVAMYDVVGVSAVAIAPDGERFMYTTGAGRTYTAVARVPR